MPHQPLYFCRTPPGYGKARPAMAIVVDDGPARLQFAADERAFGAQAHQGIQYEGLPQMRLQCLATLQYSVLSSAEGMV